MTQGTLGLADHEFWTEPLRTQRAVRRRLSREGEERAVLDAPSVMELRPDLRTLPVVVMHVAPNTAAEPFPFMEHAVLVAAHIESNRVYAAAVEPPDPDRLTLRTDGIDMPPPQGTSVLAATVDLGAHLRLPLDRPGSVLVRLLLRDRALGEAHVTLRETGSYRDPEAVRYLEELERAPRPTPVWPPAGRPLPSYERTAESPPIPDGTGISLAIERVIPLPPARGRHSRGDVPVVLRGSFSLPIRPRDRARPAPEALLSRHATAVVPISLLLLGSRYAAPHAWRLGAPSFEPLQEAGGAVIARGHFTLDLSALANLAGVPQTYFVYALSGAHISAPATTALVTVPDDG